MTTSDDPPVDGPGEQSATEPPTTQPPTTDPRPADLVTPESLVLVITGHGKGKTTAAIGTAVRAAGVGWRVAVLQFIKSGSWQSGEEAACRKLGIDFETLGSGFTWDSDDLEHDKALARDAWARAEAVIAAGEHQLVVLDEITYLCTWGWIDTEQVVAAVRGRPSHVSVVLTGRDADPRLVEMADTASEVRSIHHAYDRGIAAMRGIDF